MLVIRVAIGLIKCPLRVATCLALEFSDLVLLVLDELLRLDVPVPRARHAAAPRARHLQPLLVRQHPDQLRRLRGGQTLATCLLCSTMRFAVEVL